MPRPEVSVIVPTYGRADAVQRAVASALAQSVELEVIIVDDASETPIVVHADRARVVRLPGNVGAAGARNAGVLAARAEWIALLDSDDVWTPDSLRPRLELAKANGRASAIWSAGYEDMWPDGRRRVRYPRPSASVSDFASGCWMNPGSTALFKREVWEQSGGQDPRLRRLEDYDWLLRWSRAGGELFVYQGVVAQISRGSRASPHSIAQASDYVRAKHRDLKAPLRRRMESYLAFEMAAACLAGARRVEGVTHLLRSWLLHPRAQPALEPFWRR